MLCGFGLVELLSAILVFFLFEHTPSPWGAGTLPDGFGRTDLEMYELCLYEARVVGSCFGAALMGVCFLLGGTILYFVSRLAP
jgi:hypothetical protein